MSEALIFAFPELTAHFGADALCEVGVVPNDIKSGHAVQFVSTRGIVYGEPATQKTTLNIYCNSTSKTTQELALSFESQLMLVLNATFNNFVIRTQITEQALAEIQLVQDNVGLATSYDFKLMLTPILDNFVENFNAVHVPDDLSKKIPTVKFVAGLLMKTLLTPYQ